MSLLRRIAQNIKNHYKNKKIRGVFELLLGVIIIKFPWLFLHVGFKKVFCPICNYEGKRFLPFRSANYISFNANCPRCLSTPYHRGHYYFYKNIWNFEARKGQLLFIAPEPSILKLISLNTNLIIKTADLYMKCVDYKFDLVDIPLVDQTFDYIICHRVIEHTSDDTRAMSELLRILKQKGELIFSVPIDQTIKNTIEYKEPNPLEDFHYYHYGTDFENRIPKGFEVKKYKIMEIVPKDLIDRLHLIPPDILYHIIKTN